MSTAPFDRLDAEIDEMESQLANRMASLRQQLYAARNTYLAAQDKNFEYRMMVDPLADGAPLDDRDTEKQDAA
jgi:hypothetical protein